MQKFVLFLYADQRDCLHNFYNSTLSKYIYNFLYIVVHQMCITVIAFGFSENALNIVCKKLVNKIPELNQLTEFL